MTTTLTPEQQKAYFASQSKATAPLSPLDWLKTQSTSTSERLPGESIVDFTDRLSQPSVGNSAYLPISPTSTPGQISPQVQRGTPEDANRIMKEVKGGRYIEPTPATTPTVPPSAVPPPPIVGTSTSSRLAEFEKLKETMSGGLDRPGVPKSADEYARLRAEQGIADDEGELNALRNEQMQGKQELRQYTAQLSAMPEQGRLGAVSEAERNLNFRLEGLAIRELALVNRVNSKNAFIENMMGFTQQDFVNAQNQYNQEFSRNLQSYNLFSSEQDQIKKDSQAFVTTAFNMMQENGLTWDTMSPAARLGLEQQGLASGWPIGTLAALSQVKPGAKLMYTSTGTDATGNDIVSFIYQDANGQPGIIKTVKTGGYSKPEGGFSFQTNTTLSSLGTEIQSSGGTTNDFIRRSKEGGISKEETIAWLDENSDLTLTSIQSLVDQVYGEQSEADIKGTFQKWKDLGMSRENLEAQWRDANDWPEGAELPDPEKGILDDIYGGGFWSWLNPFD